MGENRSKESVFPALLNDSDNSCPLLICKTAKQLSANTLSRFQPVIEVKCKVLRVCSSCCSSSATCFVREHSAVMSNQDRLLVQNFLCLIFILEFQGSEFSEDRTEHLHHPARW